MSDLSDMRVGVAAVLGFLLILLRTKATVGCAGMNASFATRARPTSYTGISPPSRLVYWLGCSTLVCGCPGGAQHGSIG